MAHKIEELPVFQDAVAFTVAVIATLDRPAFERDRDLWKQISEANDSITANMREGFEQGSDALFIKYLYYSKGSLAEVLERMAQARRKRYISEKELTPHTNAGNALGRRLGGFIKYLAKSNFKDRGRHQVTKRQRELSNEQPAEPSDDGSGDKGSGDKGSGMSDPGSGIRDQG